MESIGQKLKEARAAKGIGLEQVARETNISQRYLEDLENERLDGFPGESYIIGFLRNYCEYLDLDADELIGLYRNQKIQETNVPVSALLPSRPLRERIFGGAAGKILIVLIVFAAAAALGFGGYALLSRLPRGGSPRDEDAASRPERAPQSYEMRGSEFRGRVFAGDSIVAQIGGEELSISVQATSPAVSLETGGVVRTVELGQEISFDVSDDGNADIRVFVSDLDASDPGAGAEIALEAGPFDEPQAESGFESPIVLASDRTAASATGGQTVLFESSSAYPVTLSATFRGNCLFRYEIDRRDREERLYQRSEALTVQARDGFRIWASNGNAVRLQVIAGGRTVDLELSRPGEVIVKDLRWFRDDASGRYSFVAMDVD